ncbi:MAG: hypothetical protein J6P07_04770 [Spirochaetaceae bacterium]|nr:hypothetical protein [Spirochaetaceae bacterium]MBO7731555.1 hypothetical protein [Methanobrevibacter sp.]
MIDEKASEHIKKAVEHELQNIQRNWGGTYHSTHEAFAVLKEETEEAADALDLLNSRLEQIWNDVKLNWDSDTTIYGAQQAAIALAEESVQCAAVCMKFLESIKKK